MRLINLLELLQRQQLSIMQQFGASVSYTVVWWHKLREVDNKCTLHNSIVLAICLPKIIKFGGDLTKYSLADWFVWARESVCTGAVDVIWRHFERRSNCDSTLVLNAFCNSLVLSMLLLRSGMHNTKHVGFYTCVFADCGYFDTCCEAVN